MKIWTVWFSDCFNTTYKSCSVFPFPPKLVEVYEIWIIVCIWAFFFLLTSLGSFYKERLIWASKTKSSVLGSQNICRFVSKGPNQQGDSLFSSFFGELFFSCFLNLQSEMMIDADLYPLSYNLELISIFPLTEDTG